MTQTVRGPTVPTEAPPLDVVLLGRSLVRDLDALTDRLVVSILDEDPSYGGTTSTPREDLWQSCHDNLLQVLLVLTGDAGAADPLDTPRATGVRRAEQGVPLESVLHAYRLGFRTIWDALVTLARTGAGALDVLVGAASTVWEIVDAFSTAVGDGYRATESRLAGQDARRAEALLDALLDGRGAERAVAEEARTGLGLAEHSACAVVVLEGADAERVAAALSQAGLRAWWRTRAGREIGLVPLGRACPADVCAALAGLAGARAGVSPAVQGVAEIGLAHRLADTALRALPPGTDRVVELDDGLPGALLVSAPALAARLASRALGGVLALDAAERAPLLQTLSAWLSAGGSAGRTASRLSCHRNTVRSRLRRVEALTGRSLEDVDDLVEFSLALLALRLADRSELATD